MRRNTITSNLFWIIPVLVLLTAGGICEMAMRVHHRVVVEPAGARRAEEIAVGYEGGPSVTYDLEWIPRMEFNSYLGYRPVRSTQGHGYAINANGFRYDSDLALKKKPGETRIFVVGGSAAWGAGVNQRDLYTNVAERIARQACRTCDVRIISAGGSAYVSTQELLLTLLDLSRYEPDAVVMLSGWNDIYAGYWGFDIREHFDYFGLGRIINDHYKRSKGWEMSPGKLIDDSDPAPDYASYTSKIHYLVDKAIYARAGVGEKKIEDRNKNKVPPADVVTRLEENISRMQALAKNRGFELVFWLQPTYFNTRKPLVSYEIDRASSAFAADPFGNYVRDIYDLYRLSLPKHARARGYRFQDADPLIAGQNAPVFVDGCHLNDRGNRLLGQALAELALPIIQKRGGRSATSR